MTSVRSLTKLGKQPGKQIQDAVGSWVSTPTQRDGKLWVDLTSSLRPRNDRGLTHAEGSRAPATTCVPLLPPCFSDFGERGGEAKKTASKGRCKQLRSLGERPET